MSRVRCAIYTRKSSEEGLEQDFNSLDAQHEACAAYVASQTAEGWKLLPARYDDGGLSGGTLDRPALQSLLAEVDAGRVDLIVVYKIDRLTRSLSDFARIVDRLDAAGASFVSVTQSFNTATSMGRLTLNMLLSFAQFEREVTAERIRDKIRASKRKGLWMGGAVPLGYAPEGRSLSIVEDEADVVRDLFALYAEHRSLRRVTEIAEDRGYRTRLRTYSSGRTVGGHPFGKADVHRLLINPIYAGRIRHHRDVYEGQHAAIIDPETFDALQQMLSDEAARPRGPAGPPAKAPLCGKLMDETGDAMTPSHCRKGQVRHRYYVSRRLITGLAKDHPGAWRLPARVIEGAVAEVMTGHLRDPDLAARLLPEMSPAALPRVAAALVTVASSDCMDDLATLIAGVRLSPTSLTATLDPAALATRIGIAETSLDPDALVLQQAITLRRRGAEARLVLGARGGSPDPILLANIRAARSWHERLLRGETLGAIAEFEGIATSRIRQMIPLAFLAPDLLARITRGLQPVALTSEWIKTHELPADWDTQRRLFERLAG